VKSDARDEKLRAIKEIFLEDFKHSTLVGIIKNYKDKKTKNVKN